MALERILLEDTFTASVDLTGSQYKLVVINSSGQLALATAGQKAFPLVDAPPAGVHGTVALVGYAKVICGGTVTVSDYLSANASAEAVTATYTAVPTGGSYAAGTQGTHIIGMALESGVSGQVIHALVGIGLA